MAMGLIQRVQIDNGDIHNIAPTVYGVCDTDANIAAKTVTIDGFNLITGTTIYIKFSHNNTAFSPTLNVSNTGARVITLPNGLPSGTNDDTDGWYEGAIVMLTYDGTNWVRNQGYNTDTDTDTNDAVMQVNTNINNEYPVIFKNTASEVAETAQVRYTEGITINPYTGILTAEGFVGSGAGLTDISLSNLDLSGVTITNDTLEYNSFNVAGRDWILGGTITAATLREDLGLSNAMHFIGIVTSDSQYTPSDGGSGSPTISGLASYTPVAGDVVIDKDENREYVYTSAEQWELLGQDASTAIDSDNISTPIPISSNNTWISRIEQLSDRTLRLYKTTLDTSGDWTGTAATLKTARTILVNLESANTASFDGSQNIELGVNGILPLSHGGTNTEDPPTLGGIIYGGGTSNNIKYASTSAGSAGQVLISNGAAAPAWYSGLILSATTAANDTVSYSASFEGAVSIAGDTTVNGTLSVIGTTTLSNDLTIAGNIIPSTINKSLGTSSNKWSAIYTNALHIGTDEYGGYGLPVYWNNGVPVPTYPVQYISWVMDNEHSSINLQRNNKYFTNTYVLSIVVTEGEEYLNGPVTWNTNTEGTLQISTFPAPSGEVSGYVLTARAENLNT